MSSLEKWLFRPSTHFFIGFFFFCCWAAWAICIFWRLILCGWIIEKYFLLFCRQSFHFIYGFLCCAKAFKSLIRSHLFTFVFISITLGDWSKKILCGLYQIVLPMRSSRSFIVSSLILMSLIHFAFFFVYGVREYPTFIILHIVV